MLLEGVKKYNKEAIQCCDVFGNTNKTRLFLLLFLCVGCIFNFVTLFVALFTLSLQRVLAFVSITVALFRQEVVVRVFGAATPTS